MRPEQKIAGIGAAFGALSMIGGTCLLSSVVPESVIMDTTANRLAYALAANMLAVLPLCIMMAIVGIRTSLSETGNSSQDAVRASIQSDTYVADATLPHTVVFFITSLVLSTMLPFTTLHLIWVASIWFVIARILFWVGYRIHPLVRAPGTSATACLNLVMVLSILYLFVR